MRFCLHDEQASALGYLRHLRHFPVLLRLVASGAVRPGRLVMRRIALSDAADALAAMGRGGVEGITVIDRF